MNNLLFTAENLRLSIEGKKTVTRRLSGLEVVNQTPDEWEFEGKLNDQMWSFYRGNEHVGVKPKYHVGERVYLAEAWAVGSHSNDYPSWLEVLYKTMRDDNNDRQWVKVSLDMWAKYSVSNKWRSPRFMPEWAARYFAEIISVGCGRLQDMNEQDARDEGMVDSLPLKRFANLWNEINPKMPFSGNWWVFVYGYRMVKNDK